MGTLGIIVLVIIGVILILLELFLFMGSIKIGLAGLVVLLIGIFMIYGEYGTYAGNLALGISTVGGLLLTMIAFRFMSRREVGLMEVIDGKVNVVDQLKVKVGDTAEAFGDLKLGGRIKIGEEIFDAESIGDFIDDGTKVMITKVTGNQIFVKSVDDEKYIA